MENTAVVVSVGLLNASTAATVHAMGEPVAAVVGQVKVDAEAEMGPGTTRRWMAPTPMVEPPVLAEKLQAPAACGAKVTLASDVEVEERVHVTVVAEVVLPGPVAAAVMLFRMEEVPDCWPYLSKKDRVQVTVPPATTPSTLVCAGPDTVPVSSHDTTESAAVTMPAPTCVPHKLPE